MARPSDGPRRALAPLREAVDRLQQAGRLDYSILVLGLLLVWGVGDLASTLLAAAATGGAALEANPLVRTMLVADPLLFPVVKAAVVLVAGVTLLRYQPLVEQVPGHRCWFASCTGVGVFVSLNNVLVGLAALA